MAEEELQRRPGRGEEPLAGLLSTLQGAEARTLQSRINNSICKSVQSKVESILLDVEKFSDIEKLYLYLKLPSGPSSIPDKSDQNGLSSSRTQQTHAFSWIQSHLEEYPETSLPKQEVYDEYKSFCDNLNYHPLSAADFGKMMKNVFPNMKARRLGMRGKSKYCYSGLRKRAFVHIPSLPSLDLRITGDGCDGQESPDPASSIREVRLAACDLVCEWGQKVLKRQFNSVEDLARFLISSHNIGNKSLAALTVMASSTATEVKTPQTVSAFVPTADAHSFHPQVAMLSSPSVDAKQQLQRKIQRKQQEQKMHSPLPGEGHTKSADEMLPSVSPTSQSSPPTISIVVAAVPSPITVQRSRQLMPSSPVATGESKVLPINFQMLTQTVRQSPRNAQNIVTCPSGERTLRQRYPQILPKPSSTAAMGLCSPSTMIIAKSPIKTVMTTCHVCPTSLVQMTAMSLATNSSNTTTSLASTMLQPPSGRISSSEGLGGESSRSAVPIMTPVARMGSTDTHPIDVEMEVEAIHNNSQIQNPTSAILTGVMTNRAGVGMQRAASVPIPQSKSFMGLEESSNMNCNGNHSSSINCMTAVKISDSTNEESMLHLTPFTKNTSPISMPNTSKEPSDDNNKEMIVKEGFLSIKNTRKRSSISPDVSPVKRVFIPQQSVESSDDLSRGHMVINTRSQASARPDSAPNSREVERKMSSALFTPVHPHCTSSLTVSGFHAVANTQSSLQKKNTSTVMVTSTSISHALEQQHTEANVCNTPYNFGLHKLSVVSDYKNSVSTVGTLEGAQEHTYTQSVGQTSSSPIIDALEFLDKASSSTQLPMQTDMDYFPFDDDVTQDSIVEELVQMEEQMKLNLRDCAALQGQHVVKPHDIMSPSHARTAFCHAANSNMFQTPTPTPTPTPTSEMVGGAQGLTRESPCSGIASTTPVDSALGSSRHTPVGTPHSSCSSTVPYSPVECRNPFAFTPISSNITGFHESSAVSSSPIKPMQRPMATHPNKTSLDWMNSSYSSSSNGSLNKSNGGMGILSSYQGLMIDDHFQKPHAFAVPHARHHDSHFGRLTPISPVQQQVANMATISKQEGFAVPAPLDNKTINTIPFRCRSVSPAVHQKNLCGNSNLPIIPRSVVSPFNFAVTSEMLNIFANSQTNFGVNNVAQRSRSVPLNIMMQTKVLHTQGQQCSSKNLNVAVGKMDGEHEDTVPGLAINNLPSSYTAQMNLAQIPENDPNLSCSDDHLDACSMTPNTTSIVPPPDYLKEKDVGEQMGFVAGESHTSTGEQQDHTMMLTLSSRQQDKQQQHQELDFSATVKDLLTDYSLGSGNQIMEQVSGIATAGPDYPYEIRMASELSSSVNDLNALDTNLLFDPSQQQGQYQAAAPEELVNDSLFQQITNDTAHSSALDWLENKDHPTIGLMG
ncbi:DNA-binding protein RFX7-like [Thalassophryne amazonica]|uniref:DNA-binding protein RFX7-like n=1 Tax=Thalassophryne amazonica TaxID=390379 RepID=UPI001470D6E6|nr:DNA-binding protein RFX7-like [Thalassophryne amazonica]